MSEWRTHPALAPACTSLASSVTVGMLRDRFDYDPLTGAITWIVASQWRPAGRPAGTPHSAGYLTLSFRVNGRLVRVYAHRAAWALHYGEWPIAEVDHINGDPKDNRIANLRAATRFQNSGNTRKQSNATSGFKGVHRNKGKWQAVIGGRGSRKVLGRYDTPEEAHAAYVRAAREFFGEFACAGERGHGPLDEAGAA